MPKDRAEVQDQYKIGGGFLNEFEFDQNKGAMTGEERQGSAPQPGEQGQAGPETEADRIARMTQEAREQARRRKEKGATVSGAQSARGGKGKSASSSGKSAARQRVTGPAKKSAAGKSAKKGAAQKAGAKRSATQASAGKAGKGGGKKGAARRGR